MKKILFDACTYLFVYVFFVIPPLLRGSAATITASQAHTWVFPYFCIPMGLIALFLYTEARDSKPKATKLTLFISSGYVLKTFGGLCVTAALIQFLASHVSYQGPQTTLIPHTPLQTIGTILSFIITAFYEEVIYRQFLPDFTQTYKQTQRLPTVIQFFIREGIPLLCFAMAHRYLGWLAVGNAMLCGIILRMCAIKAQSIIPGFIAHVWYNLFTLVLYILLK